MFWRACVGVLLISTAAIAADDAPPDPADALAQELQRMYTIKPGELVTTLAAAAREDPDAPPLSLLLAIAHAETSGDVLDVSEAGAVGLAQATPVALRQEGIAGKMYVTCDYVEGARLYILKKPLHDVEVIADDVIEDRDFDSATRLLMSADTLRREGVDDLDLLAEWAGPSFFAEIRDADAHNAAMLEALAHALEARDLDALRALRDRAHDEYRAAIERQQRVWKRYQQDLIARRDAFLRAHFDMRAATARKRHGYEAGDLLAEELDVRFSPSKMAGFLVRHLHRKSVLADALFTSPRDREEWTAALYNGGTHNVKRMLTGLITYLPETENYMRKVPAMRRRLDEAVAIAGSLIR